ncbi:hypothetical protein EJ06DRAFT_454844, partial [Trichodelitschia bisporula]
AKPLIRLLKSTKATLTAHTTATRGQLASAANLTVWAASTDDPVVAAVAENLAVLIAEMGEQEGAFVDGMQAARTVLKEMRDVERSVVPGRVTRAKINDELQRLKYRDPTSTRIPLLEQELVRAEASCLVADAQLTNATRAKFRTALARHLNATIARGEKQALLARHGLQLLALVNETAVVPGERPGAWVDAREAANIMRGAQEDLQAWQDE